MSLSVLRGRTLPALSVSVALAYTGIGMVVPVRILYAQSRGASLGVISAMASTFLIANFLAQYPSGWLADRWGRKRLIIAGLMLQTVVAVFYLLIVNPMLFILLRLVEGIAAATMLGPSRALIADNVPEERRGAAYGIFSASFNAGFLFGPAIGGLIAGMGYSSAFLGAIACRLIALALVIGLVREAAGGRAPVQARRGDQRQRALFTLALLGGYILAFGDYLYFGFDLSLMPIWLRHQFHAPVTAIGLAYVAWALPTVLLAPIGGRLADRVRRSTVMLCLGLAQVPFYLAYGLLSALGALLVLFCIHGTVYALMMPSVDAHVAAAAPPGARARTQSVYSAVGLAGAFVAANGLDWLYAQNTRLPVMLIGVAYGGCVVLGGSLVRRRDRIERVIAQVPQAQAAS